MEDNNAARAAQMLSTGGYLRVAINYGNGVLAQKSAVTGEPVGVSVDLSEELARRLNLGIRFVTFDAARKVVTAMRSGECDLAFLAIDPLRGEHVRYTEPYVAIPGGYLTTASAPFISVDDVDRTGVRISVGKNAAYDLYLMRTLENAELVRASTTSGAVDLFISEKLDVAAGIKSALIAFAVDKPEYRIIEGSFMEIKQAICVPNHSAETVPYLNEFIEEMIITGFVRDRLEASGQDPAAAVPR